MRIFLADDEKHALKYLFDCLTELRPEAELVSFDRSDEALEYIRKDAAFDVAFLDISMPVINGVELAKELKKLNPTINIVFCTAHEQYAMDAVKLHVSGYVCKPYVKENIETELENLLHPIESASQEYDDKLVVRCFGMFDVYFKGKPLAFKRKKTKELFAYSKNKMIDIKTKQFGILKDGRKVTAFEMKNGSGMSVRILDYGCTIQSIVVPDRNGVLTDVVLGYDDISSYEEGSCFYGAIVGRYANRIGDARFILDGKEYLLEKTSENKLHHLHGVYAKRLFDCRIDGNALVFNYRSPDGEEGFPGNLNVEVRYTLGEDNSLTLYYTATTDAPTILNLTNHCYFNLNGQDGSTVLNHKVYLNSSYYTEYTPTFAQTGRIIPVDGTPLDFRKEQTIGARFNDDYHQFKICTGYDHNMVLDGKTGELKPIGTAKSDKSGITLEAFTTEPAIQFYSANFIQYDLSPKGKNGIRYPKNGGLCFEAQHYPDSMNHKHFPNVILRPDEIYRQKTIYKLISD